MKTLITLMSIFCAFNLYAQWQPDIRLTNDPAESATSLNYARCIASSGDTVHVVWYDARNGATQFYYKRSTNGGIGWGPDTRLSNSTSYAERGGIAVSGQTVHVVWQDWRNPSWEIYYKRSPDGGLSWGQDTRLTYADGNSWGPTISVVGTEIHVLWTETRDGNPEVYYKRSPDGGTSWGSDTRLTNNTSESWYPTCALSGSIVNVLWSDNRDGHFEVYYKRSPDGGLSWGQDTRLTNTNFNSQNPSVAFGGSTAHIVYWSDRDGNWEIYYKKSTDGGLSWGPDVRLTNAAGESYTPSIDVSGSILHVIWEDTRDGDREIYYKRSLTGGSVWEADTRLTNSPGESHYPSICYSGIVVHAVWFDERDGNREIYYKRNPTGNSPPLPPLPPNLSAPPNGSYNQPSTVRFIWNKSFSALTYRLQVALDSLFTNLVVNDSTLIDSTILVTNLTVNKYYWWRVNAKNTIGTSPYSAVWKFGTFFVGLKEMGTETTREFRLYENYPNPFNPTTKIRFDIRSVGAQYIEPVQLTIFDILGREVANLVNENLKPGKYEIEFDGTNFASGIYYYKIVTEYYTDTKKMVLLK